MKGGTHMPRFRALKNTVRNWIHREDWSADQPLPPDISPDAAPENRQTDPASLIGPLFACLPEGSPFTERAAAALGGVLRVLRQERPEEAKNVIRRFMWHMNEESGNIGWGIPEAFGEALAQSRPLTDDFYRVLFSYVRNREGDNTWCDYAPLRLSCYRAVERVITAWPDLKHEGLCVLHEARNDPDPACRELARDMFERLRPAPGETARHILG